MWQPVFLAIVLFFPQFVFSFNYHYDVNYYPNSGAKLDGVDAFKGFAPAEPLVSSFARSSGAVNPNIDIFHGHSDNTGLISSFKSSGNRQPVNDVFSGPAYTTFDEIDYEDRIPVNEPIPDLIFNDSDNFEYNNDVGNEQALSIDEATTPLPTPSTTQEIQESVTEPTPVTQVIPVTPLKVIPLKAYLSGLVRRVPNVNNSENDQAGSTITEESGTEELKFVTPPTTTVKSVENKFLYASPIPFAVPSKGLNKKQSILFASPPTARYVPTTTATEVPAVVPTTPTVPETTQMNVQWTVSSTQSPRYVSSTVSSVRPASSATTESYLFVPPFSTRPTTTIVDTTSHVPTARYVPIVRYVPTTTTTEVYEQVTVPETPNVVEDQELQWVPTQRPRYTPVVYVESEDVTDSPTPSNTPVFHSTPSYSTQRLVITTTQTPVTAATTTASYVENDEVIGEAVVSSILHPKDVPCINRTNLSKVPSGLCRRHYLECVESKAVARYCEGKYEVFSSSSNSCVIKAISPECKPISISKPPLEVVTTTTESAPINEPVVPRHQQEQQESAKFCSTRGDGIHRHPHDCSRIVQCFGNKRYEYPSCIQNLAFDERTNSCNYRDQVEGCSSNTPKRVNTQNDVTGESVSPSSSGHVNDNTITQSGSINSPDVPNGSCNHGDHVIDVNDCSKYYRCVWDRLVPMACPDGLFFDDRSNTCNYANQVDCQASRKRARL